MIENEHTEFKAEFTPSIYKEVIAFANTEGGTIYVGVDDDGNALEITDVDEVYSKIRNRIRDAIEPDVTAFIQYELQDNNVIKVAVDEGAYKPYYLKAKGLKPSGIYVKQGNSRVQASFAQIRSMINISDDESFEMQRSLEQNLTFTEAEKTFQENDLAFTPSKYSVLGIQNIHDLQFTNLALLLSDQCPYTTKVAIFEDDDRTFHDKKIFSGSIFKQLDEVFAFLQLCNNTVATVKGLHRIETPAYPENCLREGLVNALVHRSYSFSGSNIINVYKNRIEFISLGGLVADLSESDIMNGISLSRNSKLSDIFQRLKISESYGRGIQEIFSSFARFGLKPQLQITENSFKLILPNINEASKNRGDAALESEHPNNVQVVSSKGPSKPSVHKPQVTKVLEYLQAHERLSFTELQDLLKIKQTRAYVLTKEMSDSGLIKIEGKGSSRTIMLA